MKQHKLKWTTHIDLKISCSLKFSWQLISRPPSWRKWGFVTPFKIIFTDQLERKGRKGMWHVACVIGVYVQDPLYSFALILGWCLCVCVFALSLWWKNNLFICLFVWVPQIKCHKEWCSVKSTDIIVKCFCVYILYKCIFSVI